MRKSVRQFRGTINKELGDGLIAAFGAPNADDVVFVTMKAELAPDPNKHDLGIEWVQTLGVTTLKFTMICPYEKPPAEKKY